MNINFFKWVNLYSEKNGVKIEITAVSEDCKKFHCRVWFPPYQLWVGTEVLRVSAAKTIEVQKLQMAIDVVNICRHSLAKERGIASLVLLEYKELWQRIATKKYLLEQKTPKD